MSEQEICICEQPDLRTDESGCHCYKCGKPCPIPEPLQVPEFNTILTLMRGILCSQVQILQAFDSLLAAMQTSQAQQIAELQQQVQALQQIIAENALITETDEALRYPIQ